MPLFYVFDLVPQHFGYHMYVIRLKTYKLQSNCDRSASIQYDRLILRMYCIDTGAIAFMFNGGSSCGSTIHPIDTKIGVVYLCY